MTRQTDKAIPHMKCSRGATRTFGTPVAGLLLALGAFGLSGVAHPAPAQVPEPAAVEENEEVPHAFFTHEGLPEGVGRFNLRAAGLGTRAGGATTGDFAFHLETGLTKFIGLHIRNDRFLDVPRTEAMLQFAAITSANGARGLAPIIEFEVPTRSGAGGRINTLVGFTSKLAGARAAFNQALHYDPREDGIDASASLVVRVTQQIFPVLEVLGEGVRGERPIINLLGGLKVRVSERVLVGIAYQFPVTSREDFSSQLVAQPELEWLPDW